MSRSVIIVAVVVVATAAAAFGYVGAKPSRPAVAELFEDYAEGLLRVLTNPTGDPGEGHAETHDVFSGRRSIKIIPMQRFNSVIPGWAFRITEHPKPGEFRYVRFAWKADGCAGIMLQLAGDRGWTVRYTAGIDQFNWGSKFVAAQPPAAWTVVTRDLFSDFGSLTIRGIALTAFKWPCSLFRSHLPGPDGR